MKIRSIAPRFAANERDAASESLTTGSAFADSPSAAKLDLKISSVLAAPSFWKCRLYHAASSPQVDSPWKLSTAEIFAARLGSPADLNLTLYDSAKNVLIQCDDTPESSDPVIAFTLPRDGIYFLGVQESSDLGGPQYGYRLQVK